jgi:hypothetical protein
MQTLSINLLRNKVRGLQIELINMVRRYGRVRRGGILVTPVEGSSARLAHLCQHQGMRSLVCGSKNHGTGSCFINYCLIIKLECVNVASLWGICGIEPWVMALCTLALWHRGTAWFPSIGDSIANIVAAWSHQAATIFAIESPIEGNLNALQILVIILPTF